MLNFVVRILNVNILSVPQKELLEHLQEGVLITPNLDHLVKLQADKDLYEIYKKAEWVVCDSRILYFCSKLLREKIVEPIPGSSFFSAFYKYHRNAVDCRIFLMGAAKGVAAKAMENINESVKRKIVVGALSPSFGFEKNSKECEDIIDTIRNSGANILVVGVGAPKQEKWIMKYREKMPEIRLFMALGATIDFEAGTLKRAPLFVQKIGMEWLYRFLKEPKRLFKRYFVQDIKFFWYFILQLLGKYRDPFDI